MIRLLLSCAACALFVGCAAPGDAPAPLLREAARLNRLGEDAYLRGDNRRSVPALTEGVRLHLAAGDLPGAEMAMVNLALAQRVAGKAEDAPATVKRLNELLPAAVQQAPEQAGDLNAATAWITGTLALDSGDIAAARQAADRPIPLKPPVADRWEARLKNLEAEVALRANRPSDALAPAQSARTLAGKSKDRGEEARAWRFEGAAHRALSQWNESRAALQSAVRLEQQLGGGTRMAGDLRNLAEVSEHLGDSENAALYRQRAEAIESAH